MGIAEWVRSNLYRVRSVVEEQLGEDAGETVFHALQGYVHNEERNVRMRQQIADLQAQLERLSPAKPPEPPVTYRSQWD